MNSVENYPRASVVDRWRRIEPLTRRASSVLLAMWFEHGTLTYSCPETTRRVRTGIIADTATIEKLSFFKLSVWCPHCAAPHMIAAKDASISWLNTSVEVLARYRHENSSESGTGPGQNGELF